MTKRESKDAIDRMYQYRSDHWDVKTKKVRQYGIIFIELSVTNNGVQWNSMSFRLSEVERVVEALKIALRGHL